MTDSDTGYYATWGVIIGLAIVVGLAWPLLRELFDDWQERRRRDRCEQILTEEPAIPPSTTFEAYTACPKCREADVHWLRPWDAKAALEVVKARMLADRATVIESWGSGLVVKRDRPLVIGDMRIEPRDAERWLNSEWEPSAITRTCRTCGHEWNQR
jgi:hypothetical protein